MTMEDPKSDSTTAESGFSSGTSTDAAISGAPGPVEEKPKEKKPVHDCIICDPFEACKHTVPLHETIKPLIRGKTGVEDMFLKASEIADWLMEAGLTLKKGKDGSGELHIK